MHVRYKSSAEATQGPAAFKKGPVHYVPHTVLLAPTCAVVCYALLAVEPLTQLITPHQFFYSFYSHVLCTGHVGQCSELRCWVGFNPGVLGIGFGPRQYRGCSGVKAATHCMLCAAVCCVLCILCQGYVQLNSSQI
jgi:hypothetical protein